MTSILQYLKILRIESKIFYFSSYKKQWNLETLFQAVLIPYILLTFIDDVRAIKLVLYNAYRRLVSAHLTQWKASWNLRDIL